MKEISAVNSIHEVVELAGPPHDRVLEEIARWWQQRSVELGHQGDYAGAEAATVNAEHYSRLAGDGSAVGDMSAGKA